MPQSLPLASRWHRKACEGGDGQACSNLGVCYQKGDCGFAPDAQQAGELYQKACDRGSGDGCRNLGVCYHIGACGVTRDEERAVQLVRKACEQGSANACSALRAAAESTSAGPQLPAPASGSLVGAWKWNGDVTVLRADGTGTYYRDGSVCYEFRYVLQGDQYAETADRDSQCSGSRQNSYRYRTENDVVVLTHIGSGFESRWRRTSFP
jgi:TPR repeat protein